MAAPWLIAPTKCRARSDRSQCIWFSIDSAMMTGFDAGVRILVRRIRPRRKPGAGMLSKGRTKKRRDCSRLFFEFLAWRGRTTQECAYQRWAAV
jgi:hypothetical protein